MEKVATRKRDNKETVAPYTRWTDQLTKEKDTISAGPI